MTAVIVVLAIIVALLVLLAGSAVRILREYERGVVFRLGRLIDQRGPGLVLLIPVIDRMVRVSLRTVTMRIPSQDLITRDNVPARVTAVTYFRVVDANRAVVEVESYENATSQIAHRRFAWGDHSNAVTPPGKAVKARASPPSAGMTWICALPPRSERKARRVPSGDQRGCSSMPRPWVSCVGSPPSSGTRQIAETYRSPSTSIDCTEHSGDPEFVFQIAAPAIDPNALSHNRGELPGLLVRVETNAGGPTIARDGELVELHYRLLDSSAGAPVRFTLWVE